MQVDPTAQQKAQDDQNKATEPANQESTNSVNYFDLFGLPLTFLLDRDKLEDTYLKLQANFHPDNYVAADVLQRSIAAKQSSLINIAYKELLNPTKRAGHLLRIIAGAEADKFTGEATIADTDFLMEQMKWREAIDDGEGDADAMLKLLQEIQQTQEDIYKDFENTYSQNSPATQQEEQEGEDTSPADTSPAEVSPEVIKQLGGLITKMQYFSKLEQDLESRS